MYQNDETLQHLKNSFSTQDGSVTQAGAGEDELENGIGAWREPVVGENIAYEIYDFLGKHIIMSEESKIAVTLWVMGTYIFNEFRIFPKLLITSPEKRCGKTSLMEILASFCHRVLSSSNTTAAAVFRAIEMWQPTLLIDEADTFLRQNEELRGIINSGHNRSGAHILRVEGDARNRVPKRFSTWAPMAIAMIKTPKDTILDRSIIVELKRKTMFEKTSKLPSNLFENHGVIRKKLQRWGIDNAAMLSSENIELPDLGNDRAQDNWLALVSIAKLLSSGWYNSALGAYKKLTDIPEEGSIGVLLLQDIKQIFFDIDDTKIHTSRLLEKLNAFEEQPWCEFRNGRPLSAKILARLLKPFGVKSEQIWENMINRNGYRLESFLDAFNRYLLNPDIQPSKALESERGKVCAGSAASSE